MPPRQILFVTGASGSGKTAVLQILASRIGPTVPMHHFDSVGVPSLDEMIGQYGSPEAWQEAMTHQWITRLVTEPTEVGLAVLGGQVRPTFVLDAFRANGVKRGRLLLLDCAPDTRTARLAGPRGQPELANPQMMAWSAYLRGQADALRIPVLDTTGMTLDQTAEKVAQHIDAIRTT